jgi:hypothetical protein
MMFKMLLNVYKRFINLIMILNLLYKYMESCPVGFFCFNTQTIGLIIAILVLIIVYLVTNKKNDLNYLKEKKQKKIEKINKIQQLIQQEPNIVDLESTISGRNSPVLIKNNNIYVNPTSNGMLINKEYERIINPLLPPERSYDTTYRVPINIPTRGISDTYQQVGAINNGEKIFPLFGRPLWPGSSKWNFYTSNDAYNSIKLPIQVKKRDCLDDNGCDELYNGDSVSIPQYGVDKEFKVSIYNLDKPRYIPYL